MIISSNDPTDLVERVHEAISATVRKKTTKEKKNLILNRPEPCTCPAPNPANEIYGECPREQECFEHWLNRHQGEEGLDFPPERSL